MYLKLHPISHPHSGSMNINEHKFEWLLGLLLIGVALACGTSGHANLGMIMPRYYANEFAHPTVFIALLLFIGNSIAHFVQARVTFAYRKWALIWAATNVLYIFPLVLMSILFGPYWKKWIDGFADPVAFFALMIFSIYVTLFARLPIRDSDYQVRRFIVLFAVLILCGLILSLSYYSLREHIEFSISRDIKNIIELASFLAFVIYPFFYLIMAIRVKIKSIKYFNWTMMIFPLLLFLFFNLQERAYIHSSSHQSLSEMMRDKIVSNSDWPISWIPDSAGNILVATHTGKNRTWVAFDFSSSDDFLIRCKPQVKKNVILPFLSWPVGAPDFVEDAIEAVAGQGIDFYRCDSKYMYLLAINHDGSRGYIWHYYHSDTTTTK